MVTDDLQPHTQHRRPHPQPMAAPFLECDLGREIEQLHREPEWRSGHNARTLVKYDDFRIVLTALKGGARISEHHTGGRLSIHTVRGHLQMRAADRTFDLATESLVALDRNVRHELEALEDTAFLLTIAWPLNDQRPSRPV
jgi:quercetin dioxygenase-like cupin family protein